MVARDELVGWLDAELDVAGIADSSVNGLQVEGRGEIRRVGLATDAALEVFERAVAAGCDLVLAHHGLIWGGLKRLTGPTATCLRYLFASGLNVYAAHLPLDLHPRFGNNARLAALAGLEDTIPFGDYHGVKIGFAGRRPSPVPRDTLTSSLAAALGATPLLLPFGPAAVSRVGIVSGGGSSLLPEAIAARLDLFVTGEPQHQDHHLAREGGINVLYLGHYHTETVGVRALGDELARHFALKTVFLDVPTLV